MHDTRVQLDKLGLPFHPKTGLQAVGVLPSGRVVWPIAGADGTEPITVSPMLQRLYDERKTGLDFVDRTIAEANSQGRDLSVSEKETLANYRKRTKELDEQIE